MDLNNETVVVEKVKRVLQEVAVNHNFVHYDIEVTPISSGGANYSSTLYNATIKENDKLHHLFVKVAVLGEEIRSEFPNPYEAEIFVYTKLMDAYERLQNKYQVPEEHRLKFSKYYGCNATLYEEIVVLENLVAKGYQSFDRFQSFNWEYASSAVTELAKMHALSFAHSEEYPEDFKKILLHHKFEWSKEGGTMVKMFESSASTALETVQGNAKDKLKKFFESFGMHKYDEFIKATRRPVLIHGDFRPSNLMHKNNDDGTVDVKVCDLQTIQGGSPVMDLLYFIFTGSDEHFRAQYYEKLIDYYYTKLHAAMKRLHLNPDDVYSRADFDHELQQKLPFGLTVTVMGLPILTVSVEDAPKLGQDLDFTSFSATRPNDLYVKRLNGAINDFIKFGILK